MADQSPPPTVPAAAAAAAAYPAWMTREYFADAVAQKLQLSEGEFEIGELHVKSATEAGDNFASKLYRVTVDVSISSDDGTRSTKAVPLIVKAMPELGLSEELIQMMNVFPKETEMYTKVLPGFEALYREKGQEVSFGPKCWKHCTTPTDVLVLEDLSEYQFRMANRRQGLDRTHAELVLSRLAQFHAASAVYQERNGNYSALFNEGIYAERSMAMFEEHSKAHMASSSKMIRTWPNGDFYADLMLDFGLSMFTELINVCKANPNGFNVLNHGDAWCNNFMFKYGDDDSLEKIALVDFQMCIWSSPAIDLLYFMFSSINGSIKLPLLDTFIGYYHQHLVSSLQFLGYSKKPPTLKDLHLDFVDRMLYGFATCFGVLPICLMEKTEDASLDTMMAGDEAGDIFRQKMYGNPALVEQMTELMPYFYNYGAFDVKRCGHQKPSGITSEIMTLPSWMRKDFFNDVVEGKLGLGKGQYNISRVWVEIATKKGDNYGSIMYRAKLDVESKVTSSVSSFSVILKTRPTGMAADFSETLDPFGKEIEMYTKIIPAFEKLYREKGLNVEIGPRCLKVCQGIPSDIIVMEDLGSQRYKLASRQDGLNQEHAEMILEKLAQFHAASAVYRERNGAYSKSFNHGLYNKDNLQVMEYIFGPAYQTCVETLKTFPFAESYIETLETLRPVAFSRTLDSTAVDPDGFNVLNHGDFWVNNMMFQYGADGKLQDGSLIDFQISFYGSPVLDLNYFLFTSVEQDIKLPKLHYFIRHYHEKLVSNLELLGYGKPLPTLRQLQVDFFDRIVYGCATIFGVLVVILSDPSDDVSLEMFQQDTAAGEAFRQRMYTNERYVRALESLLPYFAGKGAFESEAEICQMLKKKCDL